MIKQHITTTSHGRHVVSNHRSLDCLFNRLFGPTSKKHQSPRYWPFVRGIHRWPVNSPHKGPVTLKKSFHLMTSSWNMYMTNLFSIPEVAPEVAPTIYRVHVCHPPSWHSELMMTSSNGTIFRVTSPLWGEFTNQLWIPLTKVSSAELFVGYINRCSITGLVPWSNKPLHDTLWTKMYLPTWRY